jgi:KDO2-lipid IV(A) lauroyltransferase
MNHSIEALIKRLPEQYMWSYRRFKSTHSYV